MFGNENGSSTVEAAIITPFIMIVVCVIFIVIVKSFQYGYGVMEQNTHLLKNEKTEVLNMKLDVFNRSYVLSYQPSKSHIKIRTLIDVIEYLFYLISEYYKGLKVFNEI